MSSFVLLQSSLLPNATLNLTALPIHEGDPFASAGFCVVLILCLCYVGTAMLSCRRLLLRSDALLYKAIEPLPPSIAVTRPRSVSTASSFSGSGYQAGTASMRSSSAQYGGVNNSFARGALDPRSSEFNNASVGQKQEQSQSIATSSQRGGACSGVAIAGPSTQQAMSNSSIGNGSGRGGYKSEGGSFSSQPPLISPRSGSRTPRGSARQPGAQFRSHTVRMLLSEALSLHPEERWEEVAQNAVAGLPSDGIIAFYVLIVSYCLVATIFLMTNNLILTSAVARDTELWDSSHGSSSSSSSAYADPLINVQGKLQNVISGIVAMLLFNVCLLLLLRLFSATDPVAVGRSSRAIKIRQYGLMFLINALCLSALVEISIGSTAEEESNNSAWVLFCNVVFSATPFCLCLGGIFVGLYVPWYMTKRLGSGESWAGSGRVRAAAAASSFGLFCHAFFIFPPVQDNLFLSLQRKPLSVDAILLSIDLLPVMTSVIILAVSSNDSAAAGGGPSSSGSAAPASRPLLNRSFAEMETTPSKEVS